MSNVVIGLGIALVFGVITTILVIRVPEMPPKGENAAEKDPGNGR